jgi:hypothetical protein
MRVPRIGDAKLQRNPLLARAGDTLAEPTGPWQGRGAENSR